MPGNCTAKDAKDAKELFSEISNEERDPFRLEDNQARPALVRL